MKSLKRRQGDSFRTQKRRINDIITYFSNNEVGLPENVRISDNLIRINNDLSNAEQSSSSYSQVQVSVSEEHVEIHESMVDQVFLGRSEVGEANAIADKSLKEEIRDWSLLTKISNSSVDLLLKILKRHGHHELPVTARTLKKTPRNITIHQMEPGIFWYFGISSMLKLLEDENIMLPDSLTLNSNVDGVTLFGSSHAGYWPILGMFPELTGLPPFVIGLYYAEDGSKPKEINDFLLEYSTEVYDLMVHGYKEKTIKFGNFPLDAPALAFVKDTKNHNSLKACHKCEVTGKKVSARMCYTQIENLVLRTDAKFRAHEDKQHHRSSRHGPLERLPIDMVKNFNLDYLHVVLLGVTRKALRILVNKSKYRPHASLRSKLRNTRYSSIVESTVFARNTQPKEITRSIRTLDFIGVMKGKEYRSFILYYGIVALKNNVHNEIFENYLTLHIALTICLSNEHKHLLCVAESCFKKFVRDFKYIYGISNASYNVHNLLHLVDEVRKFGPLDNYSTFPYENMIGFLKKLPSSGYLPLQQGVKRYMETLPLNIKKFKERMENQGNLVIE